MNTEYIPQNIVDMLAARGTTYAELPADQQAGLDNVIVTKHEATQDTTITHDTYGHLLVTTGNYILTSRTGSQMGMTPADFGRSYVELA